ncbi:MAG: ammonium transporter [Verrucomicrobiaceae bacterium]|nr:ammonium transporter [Verrucomicrobiaceae bacterium]
MALAAFSSLALNLGDLRAQDAAPTPAPASAPAAAAPATPTPADAPAPAAAAAPAAEEKPSVGADDALKALRADNGDALEFFTISNLWVLIAAALVFIMHLGFATVESGLCQSKNTNNILFKNVFIVCMGVLTYAMWGFNAMYPGDAWSIGDIFAMGGPISQYEGKDLTYGYGGTLFCYTKFTDFLFQAMFAATAATIVSGAVAERVKLGSFMIYATLLVTFVYPLTGSWQWGMGWLADKGFKDFAGSTLVHAFGGFAALAAVMVLGARKGKYLADGRIKPILPHSTPLATIGVFLLFLGWFGFNGGSVLSATPAAVSMVFVTTTLAGCAGGMGAIFTSWIVLKKPDLSMGLNGILAGLVGITAGADVIPVWPAVLVGLIAGVLVVFSVLFFDKIKLDDPVGAISVHGICGVWGTAAVGIWGMGEFSIGTQLLGAGAVAATAFVVSLVLMLVLKFTLGIRVSEEEEMKGLDVEEHGAPAYHFGSDATELS